MNEAEKTKNKDITNSDQHHKHVEQQSILFLFVKLWLIEWTTEIVSTRTKKDNLFYGWGEEYHIPGEKKNII